MQFFIVLCKNKEYDAHYILNFENLNNYPMELKTVSWQFYSYQNPFKKHIKEHRIYFVEQLVHRKIEQKVQKFHGYPLPPNMHSLFHYQHPPPEWCISYSRRICIDTTLSLRSTVDITVYS
jgi:hypothetical protein